METNSTSNFIDRELLAKALKSYKHDDTIEVVKFEIFEDFGEHYGSKMYRSKIDFKSKKFASRNEVQKISVVIKIRPPVDSSLAQAVSESFYVTEIEMFRNVLPAFDELYQRSGQNIEFAPELIYAADEPNMIIILEDLSPDGYTCSGDPPSNKEDSKLFVQRLAQFHAASIFMEENNKLDSSMFHHSIYDKEEIVDMFFRDTIKVFREVVETWGEEFEEYLPKLDNLIKNVGQIGRKLHEPNKRGFGLNVLNHGDFHLRNILVKTNSENRIESFKFIDFQTNVWCSPAIDLTFMMGLFKIDEDFESLKAELVAFYHQELVKALKSIGYMKAPPTLLDINLELLNHGAVNIMMWINFFPYLFIDWSNMSAEDMMGNESEESHSFKKGLYDPPLLREILQKQMKMWMYKG